MDEDEIDGGGEAGGAVDTGAAAGAVDTGAAAGAAAEEAAGAAPDTQATYSLPEWDIEAWDGEDEGVPEPLRSMVGALRGRFGISAEQQASLDRLAELEEASTAFGDERTAWATERETLNNNLSETQQTLAAKLAVLSALDSGADDPRIEELRASSAELTQERDALAERVKGYEQTEVAARRQEAETVFMGWTESYPSITGTLNEESGKYEGGHDKAFDLAGVLVESGVAPDKAIKMAAENFDLRSEPTVRPAAAAMSGSTGRPGGGVTAKTTSYEEQLDNVVQGIFDRRAKS